MYLFIGALGVLVGGAYLFQRHYAFGVIYLIFGLIWLLRSRKNPPEETAVLPGGIGSSAPLVSGQPSATDVRSAPGSPKT
jgi:threonine/homoserine/homoserine lactone efflux protein